MALIGFEGFDHMQGSDGHAFDSGSSANGGNSTRTSRFGAGAGQAWRNLSGTSRYYWDTNGNQAALVQGMAGEMLNAGSNPFFELYDGATIQCSLYVDTANRRVHVYRGSGTTNLLGSSAVNTLPPQAAGNWAYVEWKVTLNNSTGAVEVRIDGVTVLTLTNVDNCATANNYATRVCAILASTAPIDDYYAFDSTGSANNDFAGPCRVYTGYPTSDAVSDFTPLSGADNFAMVDEAADQDGDTTYNFSSTAGHKDLFGTNLGVPAGATVLGCEVRSTFRKDDVGARTARAVSSSNGTLTNGATVNAGTTYVQARIKHEINPDGGGAWTATAANALQPGYEVVS